SIEVEHFGGVRRKTEAMVGRPGRHVGTTTLEDGNVESVDAHFLQYRSARGQRRSFKPGRLRLARQPLQRPIAAALNVRGHARERNERAELAAAALELESGDVVFYP